ncbi:MAG: DegT/DnrJ/EryC1/StrS aminotransferase:Aromatic amino acid beta-eliminating lyase/threonine aldolase, partial [uncultured bacterium]
MKNADIYTSLPLAQFMSYRDEIIQAILDVCHSGIYILGNEVAAFEKKFADYHQSQYCAGVGSGTDALILAMKALGISSGDEVITVAHTALATVAAIVAVGATPVLVDVEEEFYMLDPKKLLAAISERTRAIIPVHLYGQPCDMHPIMKFAKNHNLKVIEDCAQATGAEYHQQKVGTFGDAGCFSFYPTKNLGGIGDGGAIITNNESIFKKVNALRQYGWDENRVAQTTSTVSRLDELQAAILCVKLKYLDRQNENRRKIANYYNMYLINSS